MKKIGLTDGYLQKSVQGHVYLTKTDLDTEGIYRCEASAESPTFQTVEAEKPLKILFYTKLALKFLYESPLTGCGEECQSIPVLSEFSERINLTSCIIAREVFVQSEAKSRRRFVN
ncbi:UNVERIFIED_CONTAM: hypothetical protein NCL1_16324 [Trichonephila clavipes]